MQGRISGGEKWGKYHPIPTTRTRVCPSAGMNSHADSPPPPPKETFLPGQTLNEKRCASHVYIARFIEYQTNKLRYSSV